MRGSRRARSPAVTAASDPAGFSIDAAVGSSSSVATVCRRLDEGSRRVRATDSGSVRRTRAGRLAVAGARGLLHRGCPVRSSRLILIVFVYGAPFAAGSRLAEAGLGGEPNARALQRDPAPSAKPTEHQTTALVADQDASSTTNDPQRPSPERNRIPRPPVGNCAGQRRRFGRLPFDRLELETEKPSGLLLSSGAERRSEHTPGTLWITAAKARTPSLRSPGS